MLVCHLPFCLFGMTSASWHQSCLRLTLKYGALHPQVVLTADPAGAPMYFTSDAAGGQAVTVYSDATGLASSAVLYDANKPLAIPAG